MQDSYIEIAYIEGREVAKLAVSETDLKKLKTEEFFDCIINKDEVEPRSKSLLLSSKARRDLSSGYCTPERLAHA